MQKGFSLIEIIIFLFILGIMTLLINQFQKSLTHLQLINHIHYSYQSFVYAKLVALTDIKDTHLRVLKNKLIITKDKKTIHELHYPQNITPYINFRKYLGFKPNGNTKSPGTLRLTSKGIQKELRLSVGTAKWSYYFDP